MSDAQDQVSNASGEDFQTGDDIIANVVEDENPTGGTSNLDSDFMEAIDRLDNVKLDADLDMSELPPEAEDSKNDSPETTSVGKGSVKSNESSDTSVEVKNDKKNGVKIDNVKRKSVDGGSTAAKGQGARRGSSVLAKLKKLTKSDKGSRKTKASEFKEVRVDKLPQFFIAKYLGKKDAKGLSGLQNVRRPVDKLVGALKKELDEKECVELPLVHVVMSSKGIDIREHKANKVENAMTNGLIPIDFVTYGVQDMKFWRVFTFIVIKELSSRSKTMECHAILCDSTDNARKMALSLGAAFNIYRKKLHSEGKSHNFQVELRPPDELAQAYSKEEECEA